MRECTTPRLNRTEYKAKADLVYDELRRAIMEGDFRPGDRLVTEQIAADLRVSRMPVREAIKRLQVEGLVDESHHKEATVASVTPQHIKDVFSIRAVLEGLAAREAAERIGAEHIAQLWSLMADMEKLVMEGDTTGQLAKNRLFHDAICRVSGNQLLQPLSSSLFDSIERYRLHFMSVPSRPREVLEEHRELVGAITSHNPDEAERLARLHIERTGRLMLGCTGSECEMGGESGKSSTETRP